MSQNMVQLASIKEAYSLQMRIKKISRLIMACALILVVQSVIQLFGLFDSVVVNSYPKAIFHLIYPFTWIPLLCGAVYGYRKRSRLQEQQVSLQKQLSLAGR